MGGARMGGARMNEKISQYRLGLCRILTKPFSECIIWNVLKWSCKSNNLINRSNDRLYRESPRMFILEWEVMLTDC